jgi:preprotein translocase subunit SecY
MMVNFLLMCTTLITLPTVNPSLAAEISIFKKRSSQLIIGIAGSLFLSLFLLVHTYKDITSNVSHWYFHSTPVWLIVMIVGSVLFFIKWKEIGKERNGDYTHLNRLPKE